MDFKSFVAQIKNIPTKKVVKIFLLIFGISLIVATILSFSTGSWSWLTFGLKTIFAVSFKVLKIGLPYFLKLFFYSLTLIWLPIAIYLGISIITQSRWWRFFLGLTALCGMLLCVKIFVLANISLSTPTEVLLYSIDVYLLLLWTIPREVWNIAGGVIWFIQSAIATVTPDLPGNLDDFGMITAIFAFIFLYLHTLAAVVQRFADTVVVSSSANLKSKIFNWNSGN